MKGQIKISFCDRSGELYFPEEECERVIREAIINHPLDSLQKLSNSIHSVHAIVEGSGVGGTRINFQDWERTSVVLYLEALHLPRLGPESKASEIIFKKIMYHEFTHILDRLEDDFFEKLSQFEGDKSSAYYVWNIAVDARLEPHKLNPYFGKQRVEDSKEPSDESGYTRDELERRAGQLLSLGPEFIRDEAKALMRKLQPNINF